MYIQIAARNSLSALSSVTVQDLKNIPCILISGREQRETEREYYQTVIGFQGDFLYAESLEEARLLVAGGQGFLPAEIGRKRRDPDSSVREIPLWRGGEPVSRRYCLFWKKDNSGYYIEEFAHILKEKFI